MKRLNFSPEDANYVLEINSFSYERLQREPKGLNNEKSRLDAELQNLCVKNYQVFLASANCAVETSGMVSSMLRHTSQTVNSVPKLQESCNNFSKLVEPLEDQRQKNAVLNKKHMVVLELLEMPQLMWRCIQQNLFEEAIKLRTYAVDICSRHPNIPILQQLENKMNETSDRLREQLLSRLETAIQLPDCLRVVGHLQNMGIGQKELRRIFLEKRKVFLENLRLEYENEKEGDQYSYLTEYLTRNRTELFGIITQYRAIFLDETEDEDAEYDEVNMLHSWVFHQIQDIIQTLQSTLPDVNTGSKLNDLVENCSRCGLSLGRAGADFRGTLGPIFEHVIGSLYQTNLDLTANELKFSLTESDWHLTSAVLSKLKSPRIQKSMDETEDVKNDDDISHKLMEHPPIATLCNGYLKTLNQLTESCPYSLHSSFKEQYYSSFQQNLDILQQEYENCEEDQKSEIQNLIHITYQDLYPFVSKTFDEVFESDDIDDQKILEYVKDIHLLKEEPDFQDDDFPEEEGEEDISVMTNISSMDLDLATTTKTTMIVVENDEKVIGEESSI